MSNVSYRQARSDFTYLETLAELEDQVSLMDDLHRLLKSPNQATAGDMYCDAVALWFQEHHEAHDDDKRVQRIRERHG